MNKADFQRNFQNSYYGLVFTPKIEELLLAQLGLNSSNFDLTADTLIPACSPQIGTKEQIVRILLKGKEDDAVSQHKLTLPWKENIDQDLSFMHPQVPSIGMIQGQYTATYVSRVPQRDTPRGHAPRFCRTETINGEVLVNLGVANGGELLTIWRVFNKVYFPWNQAASHVESGKYIGCAVDRFLALGAQQNRRYTQIFFKNLGSVGFLQAGQPVLFSDLSTHAIKEYVKKLSGMEPGEK